MHKERKLTLIRVVTPKECDWLHRTYLPGDTVYEFNGATYGCIDRNNGLAVTEEPGEHPFFELPWDSVD